MSAYINIEERNAVFAELKGELYKKFRKENISVEWCLQTEKLLTFAISKARTQKDIDTLRGIIMTKATAEETEKVKVELKVNDKHVALKEKFDKVSKLLTKPLGAQGGYGDVLLIGSVTLYTTVIGLVTILSEMIK